MRGCRHTWEEVARRFVEPLVEIKRFRGNQETLLELTQGVTVVELRCPACGDIAARKIPGNAT